MAEIPQQPFDLGAPPPELPQGTSSMPDFGAFPQPTIRTPEDGMKEPLGEWKLLVAQLTPDQQAQALEWWPKIWNRPSPHLDGKLVLSLPGLFMHIEGERKRTRPRSRTVVSLQREADSAEFIKKLNEYHEQCRLRQQWIKEQQQAWKDAIQARDAAMRQWDNHVDQLRARYQAAKDFPAPTRPIKG